MNYLKSKTENKLKIRGELSADVAFDANNLNSLNRRAFLKKSSLIAMTTTLGMNLSLIHI